MQTSISHELFIRMHSSIRLVLALSIRKATYGLLNISAMIWHSKPVFHEIKQAANGDGALWIHRVTLDDGVAQDISFSRYICNETKQQLTKGRDMRCNTYRYYIWNLCLSRHRRVNLLLQFSNMLSLVVWNRRIYTWHETSMPLEMLFRSQTLVSTSG